MALITLRKHQKATIRALDRIGTEGAFDNSGCGCVSADTEYLTPTGWKRIDKYVEGDLVAQFHPETRAIEFVTPLEYIKKPCSEMLAIEPRQGTNQRLSFEHRVLYYDEKERHFECSAAEYYDFMHDGRGHKNRRRFATTFKAPAREGMPFTDAELRVLVAVIADGAFNPSGSTRCTVRLKKERKKERLAELLVRAGIEYKLRQCNSVPEYHVFAFDAPMRCKVFDQQWWECTPEQLRLVADEVTYWDSCKRKTGSFDFSTYEEESANFIQYACAANGRTASCRYQIRNRRGRTEIEYTVHCSDLQQVGVYDPDAVRVVKNPEGFKYCFSVPSTFLLLRRDGYIFATGNTGKTIGHLAWYAKHRKKGGKCMLVIAPRTLLKTAWGNDIEKAFPHLKYSIATAANREKAFKQPADIYITNTDAATWLAKQPPKFFDKFDTLVVDESTAFKHATSQRSKAMSKVALKRFKYRRCLTGTPNANTITEVWHQVFILDGGKRLGNSFFGFRNCVCDSLQVGNSPHAVRWTDKPGAVETVAALLKDIVIRHELEEVEDMPEHVIYTREYDLSPKHMAHYKQMEATSLTAIGDTLITAANAAVVAGKLLQISSGAVYGRRGEPTVVDTGRYELITDLVEEAEHSIVFFFWTHQRDQLVAHATKAKQSFAVIDGDTPDSEREKIVHDFQKGKYRVLFAHPKSAAHGVTLTKATRLIWASPTGNQELFEQGWHRHYRKGQTKRTETIVVIATGTLDEKEYQRCQTRGLSLVAMLTSMKQYFQESEAA